MQSTLTIQVVIWVVIGIALASLALYRKYISAAESDILHLRDSESTQISGQKEFANRLDSLDRWGKILMIVLIVYGLVVGCEYLVVAWQQSGRQMS
jgi:hypothetical protein